MAYAKDRKSANAMLIYNRCHAGSKSEGSTGTESWIRSFISKEGRLKHNTNDRQLLKQSKEMAFPKGFSQRTHRTQNL
ncbi:uncharacterized protein ACBT44_006811 isoform 2-T2 [Syngnathus typhle]